MFTGIVQETGTVRSVTTGRLEVSAERVTAGMKRGDSVAVNGVCLTVTGFNDNFFAVDVMPETLRRTNLGELSPGDRVNLERALALGEPMGGHLVQGHIDDTGRIAAVTPEGGADVLRIEAPAEVMHYTVPKGFITVDGISLTIIDRDEKSFRVSVVAYTGQSTTLGEKRVGDIVNLEADIIGKYVAQFARSQAQGTGITAEFLEEHGFSAS